MPWAMIWPGEENGAAHVNDARSVVTTEIIRFETMTPGFAAARQASSNVPIRDSDGHDCPAEPKSP